MELKEIQDKIDATKVAIARDLSGLKFKIVQIEQQLANTDREGSLSLPDLGVVRYSAGDVDSHIARLMTLIEIKRRLE